jgi:hypothetical protein
MEKTSNKEFMRAEIEEYLTPDVLVATFWIPNEKLDMSIFVNYYTSGREGEAVYRYQGQEVYLNTFKSNKGMSFEVISEDRHFLREAERLGFLLRR